MRKLSILGVLLFLSLGLVSPQAAPGKKTPADNIPAVAQFRDGTFDLVRSDNGGAYVDGKDKVSALIRSDGIFVLDTSEGGNVIRRLVFELTDPILGTGAENLGTLIRDANLIVKTQGGLLDMVVGANQAATASFQLMAENSDTGYFLRFWPAEYPDTNNINITRLDENTWEIEASANDVAKLLSYPAKGRMVLTDEGNYHAPFKVSVTKK